MPTYLMFAPKFVSFVVIVNKIFLKMNLFADVVSFTPKSGLFGFDDDQFILYLIKRPVEQV